MKKKLLYLSQCFPVPPDGGGTIKTFNTIKTLSKKFDVYAIFISERSGTPEQLKVFDRMGVKVKVFKTYTMMESIKSNYFRLFWNYLQLRPHFVYQYRYIPGINFIKKVIGTWKPDIIHVDHINSAQFMPSDKALKSMLGKTPIKILENHNINHHIFRTRFNESKKPIRKLYLFLEGSLNYLYGAVNYKRFNHIFSISDSETQYLKKYYKSVSTQPLVYPLTLKNVKSVIIPDILFVGNLSWPPNEVALIWFLDKIFPLIIKKLPNTTIHIVGKENDKFLKYAKNKNIVFYGYQKDLDKYLINAKVFILPFKTGAGVRIKSLTALASGIPIVSTKLGVEGLKVTAGKEYLPGNSAKRFAGSVLKLLNNKNLRNKLSKNSKEYFKNNHSIALNEEFLKKYLEVTDTS